MIYLLLKAYLSFILLLKNVQSHQSMLPWHHYLILVHQILWLFTYSRPVGERGSVSKLKRLFCSGECHCTSGLQFSSSVSQTIFPYISFYFQMSSFSCSSALIPLCHKFFVVFTGYFLWLCRIFPPFLSHSQKPVCHRQRKEHRADRIDRAKRQKDAYSLSCRE